MRTQADQDATGRRPRRWELNPAAFECLLGALHPDREHSGRRYQAIRDKLITMFASRSFWPDRLVDEALDRTALKIQAGERIEKIDRYAYGVCRNLLREEWRAPEARTDSLSDVGDLTQAGADSSVDPRLLECLDQCLEALPNEDRALLFEYYQGQQSARIENRKGLSERLDITAGTLRKRACDIRRRLKACVNQRLPQ